VTVTIIAALSENRVIGRDGDLPWHLPDDLRRFKTRTSGHAIIMGRRTFESVGRPLPNRRNIVVTRNDSWRADGVETARSVDAAIAMAEGDEEIFIAGGGEIYAASLTIATRMDLTIVHTTLDGDVFFPSFDLDAWTLAADERHDADERHAYAFSFRRYDHRD
jgi:dihydrofolate reductase